MVTIVVPMSHLYVITFVLLMLVVGLAAYGFAVTLEVLDVHRHAADQRAKVREQAEETYDPPGTGPYEVERSADTRSPVAKAVRHA